ncbi:hypothetical protein PIB30_066911, partial [Stylosanthes scabra]|nr:hypothetical protein [Stylosanthes scabra]
QYMVGAEQNKRWKAGDGEVTVFADNLPLKAKKANKRLTCESAKEESDYVEDISEGNISEENVEKEINRTW